MSLGSEVVVAPLADYPEAIPLLCGWFEQEWPDWYGAGGRGDALADLRSFARRDGLPFGVVALCDGAPCGVAALKAESIASRRHLTPWAAAGLVAPAARGRGIGASLLSALETQGRAMGFPMLYCATGTAAPLLRRSGWELLERVREEGVDVEVYAKAL